MESKNITENNKEDKKKFITRILCTGFVLLIIAIGLYRQKASLSRVKEYQLTRFYMDTYVEVTVVSDDPEKAGKAQEAAFGMFSRLEKQLSFYNEKSFLQDVNKKSRSEIDDETFKTLLKMGMGFSKETCGAFDMTLGGVKNLYPIGKENPVPPEEGKIREALAVSGYDKVEIKDDIISKPQGLMIDPGGILKGYAVDLAIEEIKKLGITDALVNGGGNIRVIGKNIKGKAWRIGVQDPRKTDKILAVIPLDNQAVATSGDYQRYFFYKGVRYHHIIDPRTGKPAREAIAATVICPDAVMADAYSTAVFVMGKEKGIKFLEDHHLEGIIIDDKGSKMTRGLKDIIEFQ